MPWLGEGIIIILCMGAAAGWKEDEELEELLEEPHSENWFWIWEAAWVSWWAMAWAAASIIWLWSRREGGWEGGGYCQGLAGYC